MAIIIEPYVGVKYNGRLINFSLLPEEIEEIMEEKVEKIIIVPREEMWEERSEMIFVYIHNKLVEINFSSENILFLYDRKLSKTENVIGVLKQYDDEIIGKSGCSNFYRLGISMGGMNFMTVFCKDRLEFYKSKM